VFFLRQEPQAGATDDCRSRVYICNECVGLCCEILNEEGFHTSQEKETQFVSHKRLGGWVGVAERRETVKLVVEAKKNLEDILKLLNLQQIPEDA
jgi:hypothetical protein